MNLRVRSALVTKIALVCFIFGGAVFVPVFGLERMLVYFGPEGGFSAENRDRAIRYPDGRLASATLGNAMIDLIHRTPDNGTIKICLYSLSDYKSLDVVFDAAKDRGVTVKLIFDAAADWTADSRKKILDRAREVRKEAQAAGKPLNLQIKVVPAWTMKERGRWKVVESTGKTIVGTMHEKFGIFYKPGSPIPCDSFSGSANVSYTSDQVYAENRVVFRDSPAVARQFQEEFARLWNEYSVSVFGPCTSESFIPVDPPKDDVEIYCNTEPVDETTLTRLDELILKTIQEVEPNGSLDLAMFSLTNKAFAQALVEAAKKNPGARFRLALDHQQIDDSDPLESVQSPGIEREIERLGLKNISVRYKWRTNAYGWDPEKMEVGLVSFKALFLHHKVVVVNNRKMLLGSYNWSAAAETLNLENMMVFKRECPDHGVVIDGFMKEFETIWSSRRPSAPVSAPLKNVSQTVTGPEGRALQKELIEVLRDQKNLDIVQALDRGAMLTKTVLAKKTNLKPAELEKRLSLLIKKGFLCRTRKDGVDVIAQAD